LYKLTVHYNDLRLNSTVFEHVDKIIQDDDLIWLEFKPPPGWPPGTSAVLQSAAVKELKIEYEMTEMPA
jgi:pantoate kinase